MDIDEETFAVTVSDFDGSAFATNPNHVVQLGASIMTAVIHQPSKIDLYAAFLEAFMPRLPESYPIESLK
jgi:hypothetical protein